MVSGWALSWAGVVAHPEGFCELLPRLLFGRQDRQQPEDEYGEHETGAQQG